MGGMLDFYSWRTFFLLDFIAFIYRSRLCTLLGGDDWYTRQYYTLIISPEHPFLTLFRMVVGLEIDIQYLLSASKDFTKKDILCTS